MAYLIIKKQGEDFKELNLDENREFIVGRDKDCDIVLETVKGLSRKHLKITSKPEGIWVVELLSHIGSLIQEGEERTKIELQDQSVFSVPPYSFLFQLKKGGEPKERKKEIKKINEKEDIEDKGQADIKKNIEKDKQEENSRAFKTEDPNASFKLELKEKESEKLEKEPENLEKENDLLDLDASLEYKNEEINQSSTSKEVSKASSLQDTISGLSRNKPILKITYESSSLKEEKVILDCKLKNEWVVGRSKSCDVILKDKKASRKHFKILFKDNIYHIEDLNSVNGTYLNDKKLKSQSLKKLFSEDQVRLGKTKIQFEDKVENYSIQLKKIEKKIKKEDPLSDAIKNFNASQKSFKPKNAIPFNQHENLLDPTILGAQKMKSPSLNSMQSKGGKNTKEKKKKFFRLMILVSMIGLGFFIFSQGNSEKNKKIQKKVLSSKLQTKTPQKEEIDPRIKETFLSARKHYMEGKYELCHFEIQRLHKKVDSYENSKELESLCIQAFELRKIEEEKEKLKKEKILADQKVKEIIEKCRNTINRKTTVEEITKCLFPAKEIDPMNLLISDLVFEVELKEQKREEIRKKRQKYRARVQSGIKAYQSAEQLHKAGKVKKALKAYKKFIQSSYPDPQKNKEKARRAFASIVKNHSQKIDQLLNSCRKPFNDSKFKEAFHNCKQVLKVLPHNQEAKDLKKKSVLQIQEITKGLFIDSVLHESVGNLELAIKKWREIEKISVEGDDYYTRSQRKLKTYRGRL